MIGENPYYHRGPIKETKYFYNRARETERTLQMVRNRQSVSVIGPRRIGKTSLLFHVCDPEVRDRENLPPQEALFVYVDGEMLVGMEEIGVLQFLFQEAVLQAYGEDGAAVSITDYRSFDRALQELTGPWKQLVYLIDEFESLVKNERLSAGFFSFLRSLAMQRGIAYVVASGMPLSRLVSERPQSSSPFFNFFVPLYLGLFTEEDARRLIQEPSRAAGVAFSPETEDFVLELVGPHPFFLQIACYHAFELTREYLSPAKQQLYYEDLARLVRQEMRPHFEYFIGRLNDREKQVLARILEVDVDEGPRSVVEELERECLIRRYGNKLLPTSRIFAEFAKEHFQEHIGPTWAVSIPEGDRKMATVLFVDVVGSTPLAGRQVPEDYYAIIRGALERFVDVVDRHEGKVIDFAGDSVMALFGVPAERPDDAIRAVRSALEIQTTAAAYARELEQRKRIPFAVRVGLNTGIVVLGKIRGKQWTEHTAVGKAVNLAFRLQQHAQPGSILISEHTYQQIRGRFKVEALGTAELKGICRPVKIYRVLGERASKASPPTPT